MRVSWPRTENQTKTPSSPWWATRDARCGGSANSRRRGQPSKNQETNQSRPYCQRRAQRVQLCVWTLPRYKGKRNERDTRKR